MQSFLAYFESERWYVPLQYFFHGQSSCTVDNKSTRSSTRKKASFDSRSVVKIDQWRQQITAMAPHRKNAPGVRLHPKRNKGISAHGSKWWLRQELLPCGYAEEYPSRSALCDGTEECYRKFGFLDDWGVLNLHRPSRVWLARTEYDVLGRVSPNLV